MGGGELAVLLGFALAGCFTDNVPPETNYPPGCSGGGVIDPEPSTSTIDSIFMGGTVNLGNCPGDGAEVASVVVTNVTTNVAGSGDASAPYCAAFFREYYVTAKAPL